MYILEKIKKEASLIFILPFLFSPLFVSLAPVTVSAAQQVNEPNGTHITYVCSRGAPGECTWDDVIAAVQHLVDWGRNFALAFSVFVLAYAGFKYMTSGGSVSKRAEATKMLTKVLTGIVIMLAAWFIITMIINALGVTKVVNFG